MPAAGKCRWLWTPPSRRGAAGDLAGWGAAFVAMPGHKGLYGPQGTGLPAALPGGGEPCSRGTGSLSRQPEMPDFLPDRLEAGTHNVPGAAGLLEGLRFLRRRGIAAIRRQETALVAQLARGWTGAGGCRCTPLGRRGARRGCSPSGWPTGTRGGWPTPSASGAWRCGRGFTAPRWPMPPAAQRPQAPCASAFLPSTPAERWNVSSNTWQGWDRNEQKRPGFQGAFLSRRVKFPGPRGCKQGKNQV